MMSSLALFLHPAAFSPRRLQAFFDSQQDETSSIHNHLDSLDVPTTLADCRSCPNPCDQGHDEYPTRFDVDTNSQLLGTTKPYRRQVLISTGKSDWDNEITKTTGSLAAHLLSVQESSSVHVAAQNRTNGEPQHPSTGIFRPTDSDRISILNASHHSISIHDGCETVLVFPDYKLVTDVPRSQEGAQALWTSAMDPTVSRTGPSVGEFPFKSWILPYACVVLICSHKKRDNRCGLAAPKLEQAFTQYLEMHGWCAETDVDAIISHEDTLEDLACSTTDLGCVFDDELRKSSESKRVLILRTSHIGGHKFAGNCIIYTPQGSCIWYGRVSPHEVESIVTNTIINGLVLPALLRGGLNLSRPGCKTLYEW